MEAGNAEHPPRARALWRAAKRTDVLAGSLFILVAIVGLLISRNYPVGTALRMGTGYVPRLLCWVLLALGAVILFTGLRAADSQREQADRRLLPIVFIPVALI